MVGVLLLVGVTLLVMQRLVILPLERTKKHLLTIAEGDLTRDFDYRSSSASDSARSASEQALAGRDIVSQTASGINTIATKVSDSSTLISALSRRGEEIGNVVSVSNGIAEQTNLLALNAAIGAARAGEQGRGFAVVADEVRTLAGRTSAATREISQMIEKIQIDTSKSVISLDSVNDQVACGVELAGNALTAMNKIVQASDGSMQMATSIATAVEQQSATANEVSNNVESMARVSSETEDASATMVLAQKSVGFRNKMPFLEKSWPTAWEGELF